MVNDYVVLQKQAHMGGAEMNFSDWEIAGHEDEEMRLRYTGAGCAWVIYLMGGVLLLIALVCFIRRADPMELLTARLLVGIAVVIFIIGYLSTFTKGTAVIYRSEGLIDVYRKELFIPVKEEYHIGEVDGIRCTLEVRGDSGSRETFPQRWIVSFRPKTGEPVQFSECILELQAHTQAEALAKFFRVPLEDWTLEQPVVKPWQELGRSLVDTAGGETGIGDSAASPRDEDFIAPPRAAVRVEKTPGEIRYIFPRSGSALFVFLVGALICAFAVAMVFIDVYDIGRQRHRGNDFGGPAVFLTVGALIAALGLRGAFSAEVLSITPQVIRRTYGHSGSDKDRESIPLAEIEEIKPTYASRVRQQGSGTPLCAGSISIISDRRMMFVGEKLSDEELAWLCDSMKKAVMLMSNSR